jgi:transcriptional regulator with XRE-family HTH domain
MTRPSSPTVSRRWLALEIRRLRTEANLSQGAVAKALGCKVPKVSLMETAGRNVQEDDLAKLLDLFKVPQGRRTQYDEAVQLARGKAWWELYDDKTVPDWLKEYVGLEQGATRLRTYGTAVFHGLLQTPEYATDILRGWTATFSEERIARMVELRRRRQEALDQSPDPLEISSIVDEAVLRHVVGSPQTMQEQLDHVIDTVRKHDHVSVQIIPFERGAPWEANYGPFTILTFPFRNHPGVVYIEHRSGGLTMDDLPAIDTHSSIFERLRQLALSPEDSLTLLRRAARDYAGR